MAFGISYNYKILRKFVYYKFSVLIRINAEAYHKLRTVRLMSVNGDGAAARARERKGGRRKLLDARNRGIFRWAVKGAFRQKPCSGTADAVCKAAGPQPAVP